MKRIIMGLAVAVLLAFGGAKSEANTISSVSNTSFTDTYSFTAGSTSLTANLASVGVDSGTLSLLDASHASVAGVPLVPFGVFGFASLGSALTNGNLYYLVFSGVVTSSLGGGYSIQADQFLTKVAATPIPASSMMLLTGLGVVGLIAYRRRKLSGGFA